MIGSGADAFCSGAGDRGVQGFSFIKAPRKGSWRGMGEWPMTRSATLLSLTKAALWECEQQGRQTGHSMAVWAGRVQQQTSVRAQSWQMVSRRPHPHLWKRKWGPELSFQKIMQLSRCQAVESVKALHHPCTAAKVAIARYVSRWKTYWGW